MRFEQLQHLIETVESGSISEASKNLYISQQGLSDSLRRLESEIGIPILNRNKKGCSLTKQGENFYPYAKKAAESYQELLNYLIYAKNKEIDAGESVTLYVNPLLANVLIYNLLQDKSLNKIKISEASISQIVEKINDGTPILGIFLLMNVDGQVENFTKSVHKTSKLIKLFDDEIVACLAKDSPLAAHETLDINHQNIFRVDFDTNYMDYFEMIDESTAVTSVKSNDLNLHLKLMLENNAVSVTSTKLFRYMYNNPNITVRKLAQPKFATFCLLYNKDTAEKYPQMEGYIAKIQKLVNNLVGE